MMPRTLQILAAYTSEATTEATELKEKQYIATVQHQEAATPVANTCLMTPSKLESGHWDTGKI